MKIERNNMKDKYKGYQPLVLDIKFYLIDEDGNSFTNKDGTDKEFQLKSGIRFKSLEYLCDEVDVDMLEEI